MINYQVLGRAIVKAWPAWLAIVGIAACWSLSYCIASNLREQILYAGTALQVIGLLTVAEGIRQLRRMFGKPSMFARIISWFQLIVSAFRKPQTIQIDGLTSHSISSGCELSVEWSASPERTLEMLIAVLEKALNDLREKYDKNLRDLEGNLSHIESLVRDESNNRQTGDADISKMLEEVAVGGIHLEVVGLLWLLLGMFGTSIPAELAKLF